MKKIIAALLLLTTFALSTPVVEEASDAYPPIGKRMYETPPTDELELIL